MRLNILGIRGEKDFCAGLVFVVVGLTAFFWSQSYDMGTATTMGPGYFPALCGLILTALGAGAILKGCLTKIPDPVPVYKLRPFFLILASIISFALLIDHAGLIVSIFVSVFFACFNRIIKHPFEVFMTFLGLAIFSGVIFVHFFGMVIPLFPWSH